jgi:hypothetical protein
MKTQHSNRIERYCRYRWATDSQAQAGGGNSGDPLFCRGDGPNGSVDRETCRYMELSGCYWGEQPLTTPIFCNDVECKQGQRGQDVGNSFPLSTCNIKDILPCPDGYRDDGIFVPEKCQGTGVDRRPGLCPYCWPWEDADWGRNAGLRKCSDPNHPEYPWFPYGSHTN